MVPGVKVPPLCAQLPDTSNVPDGAVNVPDDKVKLVVTTLPLDPVNVPPLIVKPPLKVCVAVDAEYVPPETVVKPVTIFVSALALKAPLLFVNVPVTVRLCVLNCKVPLVALFRL